MENNNIVPGKIDKFDSMCSKHCFSRRIYKYFENIQILNITNNKEGFEVVYIPTPVSLLKQYQSTARTENRLASLLLKRKIKKCSSRIYFPL